MRSECFNAMTSDNTWCCAAWTPKRAMAPKRLSARAQPDFLDRCWPARCCRWKLRPRAGAGAYAPRPTRENNAFRHRVEALERQLTASLGGLDGALKALDSTVLSFSAQLDETGAMAEDSATALAELQGEVAMLRKRLAASEQAAGALADSGAEARHSLLDCCEALEAHLNRSNHRLRR